MSIYPETFCFPPITNTNRSKSEGILIYNGHVLRNKFYLGYYVIFNNLFNCIVIKTLQDKGSFQTKSVKYKDISYTLKRDSVEFFLKKKIKTIITIQNICNDKLIKEPTNGQTLTNLGRKKLSSKVLNGHQKNRWCHLLQKERNMD